MYKLVGFLFVCFMCFFGGAGGLAFPFYLVFVNENEALIKMTMYFIHK